MNVKKLHLIPAALYMMAMTVMVVMWASYAFLVAAKAGWAAFFLLIVIGIILNHERKKFGLTLHEILVTDPVISKGEGVVWAPGNYDFKIEEVVNRYSGNKRYVVLVRPLGQLGFTFVKEALLVEDSGSRVQDQLLNLHIISPDAVKAVAGMMKKDIRKEKSDYWHVEYREKKIKEYEELFLS